MRKKKTFRSWLGLAGLLAISPWTAGCGGLGSGSVARWSDAPVVLISVDTLRADRLSVYGNAEVPTPHMAALADDGVVFDRAFSHVPLTLPSHFSMMTGLLPHRHGVRSNAGYAVETEGRSYWPRLLAESGYAVGGAVSAFPLSRRAGFGADFDFYDDQDGFRNPRRPGFYQRPGSDTLDAVMPWLRRAATDDAPFFLFVHLFEPHHPYEAPATFVAEGRSAYDAEVVAADHWVGVLLNELRRLGVYDRALVMLVSDHGEGLGDHGESGHGLLLHRGVLQVPWILKLPENVRAGTRLSSPAGLVDLFPTVLDALGLEIPAGLDGRSQLPAVFGAAGGPEREIVAETVFPRVEMGWSELTSIWVDGLHLIQGTRPELFDWSTDPRETRNIATERRRDTAQLREQLDAFQIAFTPAGGPADREAQAALEALGYVGSAGSKDPTAASEVDPRDRIHLFEQLQAGRRAYLDGHWSVALDHFQRLLKEDPSLVDARLLGARALRHQGRLEDALALYAGGGWGTERAFELASEAVDTLRALERVAEAPDIVTRFVQAQPSDARLHGLLARVDRDLGLFEQALEQADLAVQLAPESPDAHYVRGSVNAALGRKEEAIKDLRWAVSASGETHVPAMADLSILLFEDGAVEEARKWLGLARFAEPENPSVQAAERAFGGSSVP